MRKQTMKEIIRNNYTRNRRGMILNVVSYSTDDIRNVVIGNLCFLKVNEKHIKSVLDLETLYVIEDVFKDKGVTFFKIIKAINEKLVPIRKIVSMFDVAIASNNILKEKWILRQICRIFNLIDNRKITPRNFKTITNIKVNSSSNNNYTHSIMPLVSKELMASLITKETTITINNNTLIINGVSTDESLGKLGLLEEYRVHIHKLVKPITKVKDVITYDVGAVNYGLINRNLNEIYNIYYPNQMG